MTDLKPCPFCGGPGDEWEPGTGGYPRLYFKVVGCRRCHITFFKDNGEGVEKWNRRAKEEKE